MKTDLSSNLLDKLPTILQQDLEQNLCVCNEVPKIKIINAIIAGAMTVNQVKSQTYASMGIGCCTQQIEELIEYLQPNQ